MTTHTNTTCPFCGILCTDVSVEVDGGTIRADEGLPAPCQALYAQANFDIVPETRVAGKVATLDDAVRRAAEILGSAEHPLFSGSGCDVNAARAITRLARRYHGTLDHATSNLSMGTTGTMQNSGWIGGTMSEAATHADLFVVLGSRTLSANPRFAERVIRKRMSGGGAVHVIVVGAYVPDEIRSLSPSLIEMPEDALPYAVRYLNLLTHQVPVPSHPEDHGAAQLRELLDRLAAARYSGIVWKADVFGERHTDIGSNSLARLIRTLNETTRCVSIPLGNSLGENTLNYVSLWQHNQPVRSSFSCGGRASHAPLIYETSHLLEHGLVDALFWTAPLVPSPLPDTSIRTVYIGHPATRPDDPPEVYIPTGIPGIDHAGHLFRIDSVVTIPLKHVRSPGLPSAAEVLQRIERAAGPATYNDHAA